MPPTEPEHPADPACRRILDRAFAQAVEHWGDLGLDAADFAQRAVAGVRRRRLRSGRSEDGSELTRDCSQLATTDLYLAQACEHGSSRAWELLVEHLVPPLIEIATHQGANPAEAEEAARSLPADLLGQLQHRDGICLLASYDGSGHLLSWLTVLLLRKLWRSRRARERGRGDTDDRFEFAVARDTDAARSAELDDAGDHFLAAFRDAWSRLDRRQRLAVRLRYGAGMKQRDICSLLGVGDGQVSRILAAAVDTLRRAIRAPEAEVEEPTTDELNRVLRDSLAGQLQKPERAKTPGES